MFTGLVEAASAVRVFHRQAGGARLEVETPESFEAVVRGESICVSGVCLTSVPSEVAGRLRFDVSEETLDRSTLGALRPGDLVNLERALAVGARLGGHYVQGHIDATAAVTRLESAGGFWTLGVRLGEPWARYVVGKGSIALDGVSLTVASLDAGELSVAVIPETYRATNLSRRRPGDLVNVEVDILAKYVEKLLGATAASSRDERLRALLGS
ncbi:MAG: riboflavin synthase [Thermoanaerobaculia bacterium]|nr:riboflavin synthase [Thermoanaerobaculia bacterium]